jgi:hypothetical protein
VVALLPPSLQELAVAGDVGSCAEGAALVVPPGRAQQLELRCSGLGYDLCFESRLRTGQQGTAEDVREFLRWLGPREPRSRGVETLVLGGCRAIKPQTGWLRTPEWPVAAGVARGDPGDLRARARG